MEKYMKTEIYKIDEHKIDTDIVKKISNTLINGGLVAFPTETVYGIGANALDEKAISNIFTAKGRPSDNPLIIHISKKKDLHKYVKDVSVVADKLINDFWPGPLTLIFKKRKLIPHKITGGLDTVAIRIPSNLIAREIIEHSSIPVAAPSANVSGRPSPTNANHVIEDLYGKVDIIVDGGKTNIGLESTVVDVTDEVPIILRPGGITKEMLEQAIGKVKVDPAIINKDEHLIPKSPGMKYKHYAPKGSLVVVSGEQSQVISSINKFVEEKENDGYKVGVIATTEVAHKYKCEYTKIIGDKNNKEQIASNLFEILRKMDELNIDYIYSEEFTKEDIGMAIMNRLMKAAGNQKIIL
jgi:L-threonylcarbamoyladenylate synthase